MKTELKAKFLQHLNLKKKDEGFTLIELLVVIIIIGILSAIALPSFLNQASKAKQSEAKTAIGSVNSAQTAFRNENSSFASGMSTLALGLPTVTNNYTYNILGATDTASITTTNSDGSLKSYSGGSARYTGLDSQSAIASVICEALTPGASTAPGPSFGTTAASAAGCQISQKKL